jgi:hypothetical protein
MTFLLLEPFLTTAAILAFLADVAVAAVVVGASYLLQRLVAPRPKPGEAARPDIQLTTSREGEGIPRIYGTCAVGGKIIWLGDIHWRPVYTNSGGKRSTPPTTGYSISMGILVCENRNNSILGITRIWANGNVLYQRSGESLTGANVLEGVQGIWDANLLYAQRLQILLGREDQTTRCEWYKTEVGAVLDDDVPAYRGSVVVWLDYVDLTPSYNIIPQYQFEVLNSDGTISQIVIAECTYAGVQPSQITNGAPTDGPMGWIITGPLAPKSTFEALTIWSPFDCAEVDGKLKFIELGQPSSLLVPDTDLGAVSTGREEDDQKEVKFLMSSEQSLTEVAQRVEITFYDPGFKYEEATVGYALQFGAGTGVKEVYLPMAAFHEEVRHRASNLLARSRTETDTLKLVLPPKYIKYHPGDVLTVPAPNGQLLDMRILGMSFSPGDKVEVDGIRQLRAAGVGPPGEVIITPPVPSDSALPLDTVYILSNAPPLIDDHDGFDGLYWAAGPRTISDTDPPRSWRGATLFMNFCGSDDTFKQYYPIAATRTAAVIGKARTVLGTGSGVDAVNTVDIDFPFGLGTSTVLGILNDAFVKSTQPNLCILGKEVLQFRDVDDVSELYGFDEGAGRVWRLSQLKRGLRDTAGMTGSHAINEGFVLWSPETLHRVPIDIIQQKGTWAFKALTDGQQETEIDPAFLEYDPDDGTMVLMETP